MTGPAWGAILLLVLAHTCVHCRQPPPGGDWLSCTGTDQLTLVLQPDLSDCQHQGSLDEDDDMLYSFTLPKVPLDFDLQALVRSTTGDVNMELLLPNGTTCLSTAQHSGDELMFVPRALFQVMGEYALRLYTTTRRASFTLTVSTPVAVRTLRLEEVVALQSIAFDCCQGGGSQHDPRQFGGPGDGGSPPRGPCAVLRKATIPDHPPEDDICNTVGNVCDEEGYLIELDLSTDRDGVGRLQCPAMHSSSSGSQPVIPWPFERLAALELSGNELSMDLAALMARLQGAAALQRLGLQSAGLTGNLTCDLAPLQAVNLTGNAIEGELPPCLLASPTLREVWLRNNRLGGQIPDVIPTTSHLVTLSLSWQDGGGLTGALPPSLFNAKSLIFLGAMGNRLEGQLPDLPGSLQELYLTENQLSGPLPATLGSLQDLRALALANNNFSSDIPPVILQLPKLSTVDLSNNNLTGSVPTVMPAVVSLELYSNRLSALPASRWTAPSLLWLDLANNRITGAIPASLALLPKLSHLDLSSNQLGGDLVDFALALPIDNLLLQLNVSGNQLTGSVIERLKNLGVFNPSIGILVVWNGTDWEPSANVLDLSNNALGGDFPLWLLESLGSTADLRQRYGQPDPEVSVDGNRLTCPTTGLPLDSFMAAAQAQYGFSCMDVNSHVVPVGSVSRLPPGTGSVSSPTTFLHRLEHGRVVEILGMVLLGSTGAIVLALVAWFVRTRLKHPRVGNSGTEGMTRLASSSHAASLQLAHAPSHGLSPAPSGALLLGSYRDSTNPLWSGGSMARSGSLQMGVPVAGAAAAAGSAAGGAPPNAAQPAPAADMAHGEAAGRDAAQGEPGVASAEQTVVLGVPVYPDGPTYSPESASWETARAAGAGAAAQPLLPLPPQQQPQQQHAAPQGSGTAQQQ